jgi:hypothetical protein
MAYNDYEDDSFTVEDRKNMGQDRPRRNLGTTRKRKREVAMAAEAANPSAPTNTGIGTLDYSNNYSNYSADELPEVVDPDATFASVAKNQHERYIRNYRDFENALIKSGDSTDLIDAARTDIPQQTQIAAGIAERNRQRYGYQQTGAEKQEAEKSMQLGGTLNLAGGMTNAVLAQRDANRSLLGNLINIGQGVNRSSMSGLGAAAQNSAARQQAYQNDKAAYKSQTAGFLGKLGSALASFI